MIDIHAPTHAPMTRRDFFVHLGIVVLGILIAIGLEQSVEYFHHRHQVAELSEQMRVEAQNNLPLIRESIARLQVQAGYIRSLQQALLAGKEIGASADVHGVTPVGGSSLYVSPSRATWSAAQSAGLAALMPAGDAKLYARLDYITASEITGDRDLHQALTALVSECARAHYDHANPAVQRITVAHRDDLLFQLEQVQGVLRSVAGSLSLVEGGDEAIVARVHSLDDMFRYQNAALQRTHAGGFASFYGDSPNRQTLIIPDTPAATE
ncbi:MAG TPA: hypothetical protein VGM11_05980 [Acidobacteriaceae bacterium]|jgi:hypothetical protein